MIRIDNVSFTYDAGERKNEGIRDISLNIEKGTCTLLCGRSGCGKTTLSRLVNGLIPYFYEGLYSGSVKIDGKPITKTPMYELAKQVGSVFQNPKTQFFHMDTDGEMAFAMENAAWPREKMVDRLEKVTSDLNIENLRKRNIFSLSGGEKQLIAFASIYSLSPDIYVLDEPSANLDANTIDNLKRYLMLLKEQGKTILIAEHRLYYLMDVADAIIYMEDGRIRYTWSPSDLMTLSWKKREKLGLRETSFNDFQINNCEDKKKGEPLLETKDLKLAYKKKTVLEHIDICAYPGETIAITGNNGTGKSTLSRALCGLHKPSSGSIFYKGQQMNVKQLERKADLVMQDVNYQLFAESVEKECEFGIENPDKGIIKKTLSKLDLWGLKDRHPNTLSGGQKQRLAVAAAICAGKSILIFDEPTSGLDYDSMKRVAELIQGLSNEGRVIFIITHDRELINEISARVLVLSEGKVDERNDLPNERQYNTAKKQQDPTSSKMVRQE